MALIPILASAAPGVQIIESTDGYIPVEIATHSRVYILGTATIGTENIPTLVVSPEDFTNQFGVSPSLPHIEIYFKNDPRGQIHFVRISAVEDTATVASEFVTAIGVSFTEDMPQGILIAPQAFQFLTTASDKLSVALALKDKAESELFDWFAIADLSYSSDTVSELTTEQTLYTSASGHLATYAPWIKNLSDVWLPPSAAIAGVYTRVFNNINAFQPPAGLPYPLRGVKGLAGKLTRSHQEVLNPLGVNALIQHSSGSFVIWGERTQTANPYFRFVHQRITMNITKRTLQNAFDFLIFSLVDGQDLLFSRIRDTAESILFRIWQSGAFFGFVPKEAFLVVCDRSNNPNIDLEAGIVRFDAYVALSPTLEKLQGRVIRVSIGSFTVNIKQSF